LGAIFLPGLTTPRHDNRKIRYENELLKVKEPAPDVYKCKIYRMTPKNIPQNLVRLSLKEEFNRWKNVAYNFKKRLLRYPEIRHSVGGQVPKK
jgi:hypothetical protein